jgi:threonine synthase
VEPWEREYVCRDCGAASEPDAVRWRCDCGGLLDLRGGAVAFPPALRERPPSLWRWIEALPFAPDADAPAGIAMGEGAVPVFPIALGRSTVTATLELASPTLSFKDRGAAVLVAKAVELGARRLVADSSGNAGTAIAAYAARAGLSCEVHVAASTSVGKLAAMRAHRADVVVIDGTREDVAASAIAAVEARDGFYASHVFNPFFHEGTKTWAFDLWLALDGVPDVCVLPAGNGTLVLGAARGFGELHAAGVIDRVPRIVAVQAAACAPIARAFRSNATDVKPVTNEGTIAEGIAIAAPPRGAQILVAVRASGGTVLTVEDDAIARAQDLLARQGLFVEPTAAATVAGAMAWLASDAPGSVALPLCGAGLKSL